MKTDVLTFAALVFVVGLVMSTVSVSEIFSPSDEDLVARSAQSEEARP